MRKWILVVAVLAAGIAAYFAVGRKHETKTAARPSAGSGEQPASSPPALGGSAVATNPTAMAKFQERKATAMTHLRQDLDRRLIECGAMGSGSAAPALRRVQLTLQWDPALSTLELQRFVVNDAQLVDGDGISEAGRLCLGRFVGITLSVLLPAKETPMPQLTETISLPLR